MGKYVNDTVGSCYPAKLNPGDTVGLVCPSSPVSEEIFKQCIKVVTSMGYKVKAASNICKNIGGYMAGSGEERGMWLNTMFADPEVKAIFCVRGGTGGARAVEHIDLDIVRKNPKIFVGFSDITTFHLLFNQTCNLVTFYGPMVSSNMVNSFDDDTVRVLFDCINADSEYVFRNPAEEEIMVMHEGCARAQIIGGTLSVLSTAFGTPYAPDATGKILFIEEVNEPITRIESWMYQIRNAGMFKKCAGVLLGKFYDIVNGYMPEYTAIDCIKDILSDVKCPVMYNLQSGHDKKNFTIPLGAECTMDTDSKKILFKVKR